MTCEINTSAKTEVKTVVDLWLTGKQYYLIVFMKLLRFDLKVFDQANTAHSLYH